jgi:hypothetical protein
MKSSLLFLITVAMYVNAAQSNDSDSAKRDPQSSPNTASYTYGYKAATPKPAPKLGINKMSPISKSPNDLNLVPQKNPFATRSRPKNTKANHYPTPVVRTLERTWCIG